MSRRFIPCTVQTGSTTLVTGSVVTGSTDISALVLQNGLVQVKFTPANGVYCHLFRWTGSAYTRAVEESRGDWCYFVQDPPAPDLVRVIEAGPDLIELAVEWTTYTLPGSGIPYFDSSNALNYAEGQVLPNYKRITSTKLIKSVILKRGREGFELGYHTEPRVGPYAKNIPAHNNESDWGERELGPLSGVAVGFSSANVTVRHPEALTHAYYGIDDPAVAGGAEQTTGPWWVGGLHSANATTFPFCNYVALRQRLETGSWQFAVGQSGHIVVHYVNEASDSAGVPYRTMVFIGCFPYTSPYDLTTVGGRASEPTTALRHKVANRCPLDFEETGNAEDNGAETMTAASVRDERGAAVEALW